MDDQQVCDFWFKITPTDIVLSPKAKVNLNVQKSILIKLGNKQAKCKKIGQSIQLNVQVLYSKTLNKYCPIKGIIKVYDVSKDGSQMISCVGAFNTQDLLADKPKISYLQRDIGPCKVCLTVEVKKIEQQSQTKKAQSISKQDNASNNFKYKNSQIIKQAQVKDDQSKNNNPKSFIKSPRISQGECQQNIPIPYLIDDSNDNIADISMSKCSDISDDMRKNERDMLGQQLLTARRKNQALEDKIQKSNIKTQLLRKSINQKNMQIKSYYQCFRNFTSGLQSDSRGQYIFEMNQRKREVSLKYKSNINFKQIFQEFIAFIIKKINEGTIGSQKTIDQQTEINKFLGRLQISQNEKKKYIQQNSKMTNQLNILKQQIQHKNIQLSVKDQNLKKKITQIINLQQKMRKLNEEKRGLQGMNQYLQQRDAQMQIIINTKQNTIQNLKRMIHYDKQLQVKNKQLQKVIENLQLTIDEMKQQNANLSQTIQNYRLNFGDLKQTKDKALERQIKQCLRWIDQQNRDEQLSLQDTTLTFSEAPAVTSIMRSIGEIQNMPLQEISLIRKEVIGVLKRLDEFVAKNSLGCMSP